MDAVLLARIQFAATALYHYLFVPLSVGFGLVLAVLLTKAYRSKDPHDEALANFWLRLFAGTFALGVATGITMEFPFGTNWADYSRFWCAACRRSPVFLLYGIGVLRRFALWQEKAESKTLFAQRLAGLDWFVPFCLVDHHCQLMDANPCRL